MHSSLHNESIFYYMHSYLTNLLFSLFFWKYVHLLCEAFGTTSLLNSDQFADAVIGSMKWPLARLLIYGSVSSNGESNRDTTGNSSVSFKGGIGGGSGGTILFFLQGLLVEKNSSLSASGGKGGIHGGGGGGGGRIHFHWSNIATGDEFVQIASINGTVVSRYAIM